MFLESVYTPGVAHLSYCFGHGTSAAVVDPRRDIAVYLDIARRNGCQITHVFETHRNEDLVTGSTALAQATGATIHHGHALDFRFGEPTREGEAFQFGDCSLRVLETPGHTDESLSFVLYDLATGEEPIGVFTGDTLFINDVGRTDFYPDRKEEVAGLLFDSIHEKLLPLGPEVLLFPAHGAGSVCGSGMADRNHSTLGIERARNPMLQLSRSDFIARKVDEVHRQPPYFRTMEQLNQDGPPVRSYLPEPRPMAADALAAAEMQLLDLRSPEAFAGAHVPGSLAVPVGMLHAYGGYFLDYDRPIAVITAQLPDDLEVEFMRHAVLQLYRIGYDDIPAQLANGVHGWEVSGRPYGRIPALHAADLNAAMQVRDADVELIDVRSAEEFESGHLPDARNIFLGDLPHHLDELDRSKRQVTFCGSGQRAIIAASILANAGFKRVEDCLGSMAACRAIGCELVGA